MFDIRYGSEKNLSKQYHVYPGKVMDLNRSVERVHYCKYIVSKLSSYAQIALRIIFLSDPVVKWEEHGLWLYIFLSFLHRIRKDETALSCQSKPESLRCSILKVLIAIGHERKTLPCNLRGGNMNITSCHGLNW